MSAGGRLWPGDYGFGGEGNKGRRTLGSEEGRAGMEGRERVVEFGRELREGPEPSDRSIKEIVDVLRPQLQELVAKQTELARTELAPVGKRAGLAVGLLGAAAVFMLVFLIIFSIAVIYVLNALFLPLWLAALIVSAILLVVGGILAGAGAGILRRRSVLPLPAAPRRRRCGRRGATRASCRGRRS